MRRVLAVDLGGTKTALALYEVTDEEVRLVRSSAVPSASAAGIEPIIEQFLGGDSVAAAALGVAGPVRDGVVKTTNLPWIVSRDALVTLLGTDRVTVMNDVEAASFGATVVAPEHRHVLNAAPVDERAPTTLVMIGTGFGCATIHHRHALPSELGHVTFAPRTARDLAFRDALARERGVTHVSVEHVLSGRGLLDAYRFVADGGAHTPGSATELAARARGGEAIAIETVRWYLSIIGSVLADVALATLPRGGLYLAGGVAIGLGTLLCDPLLVEAFRNRDPMREVLASIPLFWLDSPGLGLLGARTVAMRGR